MYDIRNISIYFKEIHSRYYIDSNSVFYTSMSPNARRIMIDGIRYNINSWRKSLISQLNKSGRQLLLLPIPNNKKYFLRYDGTIFQKLATRIHPNNRITICLMRVHSGNQNGNHYEIQRLVAGCFIGDITNKEVHHIDENPQNNNITNLQILTFEQHRKKGNNIHKK